MLGISQRLPVAVLGISLKFQGSIRDITEGTALSICRGLGANPFYVLDGIKPKYADWSASFGKA